MSAAETYFAGRSEAAQEFAGLPEHLQPSSLPSAAAVRASVERGDSSLVVRDRPVSLCVDPSQSVGVPLAPVLTARADEAVADDSNGPDLQLGVVESDLHGQDADAVEHERQSRLSRWQRLP